MSGDFSTTSLVEWIESLPFECGIHVYVPSKGPIVPRRQLEQILLRLGCTVTRKMHFTLAA
jgi:hypothetical protein